MRPCAPLLLVSLALLAGAPPAAAADPESTVVMADQILRESVTMAVKQIPQALLADAHAVVIVPDVIKIGFVAAVRRGHGVVLVRDAAGNWTLPQFITLTGGSVGWQAGIQGTDVILVFMTPKSVQGLLNGKFTIGADASAAAGPVGRNAAAATDARLRAEILSYSRSRGLFAGIALDGSVIDIDHARANMYYGAPSAQQAQHVPESAVRLVQDLAQATQAGSVEPTSLVEPTPAGPTPAVQTLAASAVRSQLAASAKQLFATVDDGWRKYLALPREVYQEGNPPRVESLQKTLAQYDRIAQDPKYQPLTSREDFQTTYGLLRAYVDELSHAPGPQLPLPPPPATR